MADMSAMGGLLEGLKAVGEEDRQLLCLSEVCEFLAMANEDTMGSFPTDSFVPVLVELLNMEHNPNMMLLAMRALSHMMEVNPGSCAAVASSGAIPSFIAKLMILEYIDLAEGAIQALEKVAREHPQAVLTAGGMTAVLANLDFFSSGLQRSAVSVAANCCRHLSSDNFHVIADSVPTLTNLLLYKDKKVLETACLCFSRLVDALQDKEEHLVQVCSFGLLEYLSNLLGEDNKQAVSPGTTTLIIRTMSRVCRASPILTLQLHQIGITQTLKSLLGGVDNGPAPPESPFSVGSPSSVMGSSPMGGAGFSSMRSSDQVFEILNLTNELLPCYSFKCPVVEEAVTPSPFDQGMFGGRGGFGLRAAAAEQSRLAEEMKKATKDGREKELLENGGLLMTFSEALLPPLTSTCTATVNSTVRDKCIEAITKIMHYSPPDMLSTVLMNLPISSFIAQLLSGRDLAVVAHAIEMASILVEKLPDIFLKYFRREGVFHEMSALCKGDRLEQASTPSRTPKASSSKKKKPRKGIPQEPEVPAGSSRQDQLRTWILEEAQKFRDTYMKSEGADGTSELQKLTKYCTQLKACTSVEEEKQVLRGIRSMFTTAEEGVSTYEFVGSGVVAALLTYLVGEPGNMNGDLTHLRTFSEVFVHPDDSTEPSLHALVRKLQEALCKVEAFPVMLCSPPGTTSSGLRILTQAFKLRLEKGDGLGDMLGDVSASNVMIEPLATMASIEEFLLSKLQSQELAQLEQAAGVEEDASPDLNSKMEDMGPPPEEEDMLHEEDDDDDEDEELAAAAEMLRREAEAMGADVADSSDADRGHLASTLGALLKKQAQRKRHREGRRRPRARQSHVLAISMGGVLLPYDANVFQGIQAMKKVNGGEASDPAECRQMWDEVYTVRFEVLTPKLREKMREAAGPVGAYDTAARPKDKNFESSSPFEDVLSQSLPSGLPKSMAGYDVLVLLRLLHRLSEHHHVLVPGQVAGSSAVPAADFINSVVTTKVSRQLQDPLTLCSASLPSWCGDLIADCPFLLPFECRRLYFCSTSFGVARALMRLQESGQETSVGGRESVRVGRIQRQKVRIARSQMFESAVKVMETYNKSKALLEVEYFDEVGTGLGPTLEFYSKVSRELQRASLGMWRSVDTVKTEDGEYVSAPHGLFPSPLPAGSSEATERVLEHFRFTGRFVGKALMDSRLVDLPFSRAMYKFMRREPLAYEDLDSVDPEFKQSLASMVKVVEVKRVIEQDVFLTPEARASKVSKLKLNDVAFEDLCLDFTLPGHPDMELKAGGKDIALCPENLEEYLSLVVDRVLGSGVERQLSAFASGFSEVFPLSDLASFTVEELEMLMLGTEEPWAIEDLVENTKTDHGFEHHHDVVRFLFEVMHEFDSEERRTFLKFISGSPRLPFGGWQALRPKLTIVEKTVGMGSHPDEYLPSVMTCANYLKLPRYSSKEILKARFLRAITDGQGSFLLS